MPNCWLQCFNNNFSNYCREYFNNKEESQTLVQEPERFLSPRRF